MDKDEKFILALEIFLATMMVVFGFCLHPIMGVSALLGGVLCGIFMPEAEDRKDFGMPALISVVCGLACSISIAVHFMKQID